MQKITTLTEEKKKKLLALEIKDPRIKKMLDRAVENWSKPGVKIANMRYGVAFQVCDEGGYEIVYCQLGEEDYEYFLDPPFLEEGSCLISSSLIGEKRFDVSEGINNLFLSFENEYNFSEEEADDIINIFDYNIEPYSEFDHEIGIIRDIVFEEAD